MSRHQSQVVMEEQLQALRESVAQLQDLLERRQAETRLLRIDAVMERTGLSRTRIYELMSHGRFPRPISPEGLRVSLWPSHVVEAWIRKQVACRRDTATGDPPPAA